MPVVKGNDVKEVIDEDKKEELSNSSSDDDVEEVANDKVAINEDGVEDSVEDGEDGEEDDDDDDDSVEADGLTDVGLYNVLGNFLVDDQGNTIGASFASIALELKRLNGYIKRLVPEKPTK